MGMALWESEDGFSPVQLL